MVQYFKPSIFCSLVGKILNFNNIYSKSTKYNENLMLTNLTNKKKHVELKRSLINAVCTCASYIGHTFREKQLLGVYWKCLYAGGKTPTDSSAGPGPSEEGCREHQLRQVFITVIIKYQLTHPFNDNH